MAHKTIDTGYIPNERREEFDAHLGSYGLKLPPEMYPITLFESSPHLASAYVIPEDGGFRVQVNYASGDRRVPGIVRNLSAAIIEATREITGRQIKPKDANLATLVK